MYLESRCITESEGGWPEMKMENVTGHVSEILQFSELEALVFYHCYEMRGKGSWHGMCYEVRRVWK